MANKKKSTGAIFWSGLAAAAAAGTYLRAIRPWMWRWGATNEEVQRSLPGDDLMPSPWWGWTHAITIHAPAHEIWPWLVQRGYRRGGWYTFDSLYQMIGAADFVDGHSADRIIPELQNLKTGDTLPLAPGVEVPVVLAEPNKLLLVHAAGNPKVPSGSENSTADPGSFLAVSWLWYLEPLDQRTTRLIDRCRLDYDPSLFNMLSQTLLIQPFSFILDRKMLLGIKERAEGQHQTVPDGTPDPGRS